MSLTIPIISVDGDRGTITLADPVVKKKPIALVIANIIVSPAIGIPYVAQAGGASPPSRLSIGAPVIGAPALSINQVSKVDLGAAAEFVAKSPVIGKPTLTRHT